MKKILLTFFFILTAFVVGLFIYKAATLDRDWKSFKAAKVFKSYSGLSEITMPTAIYTIEAPVTCNIGDTVTVRNNKYVILK